MTAENIFRRALSYVSLEYEDATEDIVALGIQWMNTNIQESMEAENAIRRFEGMDEIVNIPYVEKLDDDVPYHDNVCEQIAYGVASTLQMDDDNDYRTQDFRGRFVAGLSDTQKYPIESVADLY